MVECPFCGETDEITTNKTPLSPEDLARNPWFCRACRTHFGEE